MDEVVRVAGEGGEEGERWKYGSLEGISFMEASVVCDYPPLLPPAKRMGCRGHASDTTAGPKIPIRTISQSIIPILELLSRGFWFGPNTLFFHHHGLGPGLDHDHDRDRDRRDLIGSLHALLHVHLESRPVEDPQLSDC